MSAASRMSATAPPTAPPTIAPVFDDDDLEFELSPSALSLDPLFPPVVPSVLLGCGASLRIAGSVAGPPPPVPVEVALLVVVSVPELVFELLLLDVVVLVVLDVVLAAGLVVDEVDELVGPAGDDLVESGPAKSLAISVANWKLTFPTGFQ